MGMCGSALLIITSALELALHNGVHPLSRLQVGPKTGAFAEFRSYEDFHGAFLEQLEFIIGMAVECNRLLSLAHEELHPTPLLSALIEGTLDSGKDVTAGGAKYNFSGMGIIGLADVADSLAAIKKLVFEDRLFTPGEMHAALCDNFEGHEKTLALIRSKAPKYGQDDAYGDQIANETQAEIERIFSSHKNTRGGRYLPGYWSVTMHAGAGALTGALPNGKRRGESLASGATPVTGSAKKGPTASLTSSAKLRAGHMANGMCVNQKFPKSLLRQPGKLDLLTQLVKGYFTKGGMQVQFTIQDSQTLRDAQANPDQHRDLLVRISGYTAYFCDLNKKMQDEIINRSEGQI
jgi:formate C-acetyltransferase